VDFQTRSCHTFQVEVISLPIVSEKTKVSSQCALSRLTLVTPSDHRWELTSCLPHDFTYFPPKIKQMRSDSFVVSGTLYSLKTTFKNPHLENSSDSAVPLWRFQLNIYVRIGYHGEIPILQRLTKFQSKYKVNSICKTSVCMYVCPRTYTVT